MFPQDAEGHVQPAVDPAVAAEPAAIAPLPAAAPQEVCIGCREKGIFLPLGTFFPYKGVIVPPKARLFLPGVFFSEGVLYPCGHFCPIQAQAALIVTACCLLLCITFDVSAEPVPVMPPDGLKWASQNFCFLPYVFFCPQWPSPPWPWLERLTMRFIPTSCLFVFGIFFSARISFFASSHPRMHVPCRVLKQDLPRRTWRRRSPSPCRRPSRRPSRSPTASGLRPTSSC